MNIQFITDNGSDLTEQDLAGRNICILPMMLTRASDGREFNGLEIDPKWMYDQMRDDQSFTTAQVTQAALIQTFEEYASKGIPIIYIALSSGLSSTYDSACTAARFVREDYPGALIEVIDSVAASAGYGELVVNAWDRAEAGAPFEIVVEELAHAARHREHIFTVDTMEYLYKGGRVSRLAYAVASTLNIRPILNVDPNGKLTVMEKVRGYKKMLDRITDIIIEKLGDNTEVIGLHTDALSLLENITDELIQKKPELTLIPKLLGPAIGAHVGPGMIGIVFTNPEKQHDDILYRSHSTQHA